MTQQEYIKAQACLRAIKYADTSTEAQVLEADSSLKRLIVEYVRDFPPITGTFRYTQDNVDEARRAGF